VLLADFRHKLREFIYFSEKSARKAGVHPQQHQAMLAIRALPKGASITIGELAAKLKIVHHSAVELVARMAKEGLLIKYADPNDGRRVLLRLTRRSLRAVNLLSRRHKAELVSISPYLKEIFSRLEYNK
jgi:DNA-binding MarR family transcriptional regulator